MQIRKVIFFYRQFSFPEFIRFLISRFSGKQSQKEKDTYKFYEERFKDHSSVRKADGFISIYSDVNNLNTKYLLRRFSSDVLVYTQVNLKHEFEPVIELFRQHQFTPEFIIDGGANIGLTTLYLKRFYPNASVLAVEPNPANFSVLKKNIESNELTNCALLQCGLWSENAYLEGAHELPGDEWGFSVKKQETLTGVGIDGRTILSILSEHGWSRIDYLKLDIEGAEEEIFKNPETYDSFMKVTRAISIEPHSARFKNEFKKLLSQYEFTTYEFGELVFGLKMDLKA